MVAVETEDGYSIFELRGGDAPEFGDKIRWSGDMPLGGEVVQNLTQRCAYDVFFENHYTSRAQLRRQLLLE